MDEDFDWCEVCGAAILDGWCNCTYAIAEGLPPDLQEWLDTGVTHQEFVDSVHYLSTLGQGEAVDTAWWEALRYAVHSVR